MKQTVLDDKRIRWKAAVKAGPVQLHVDRKKYATESWKQTEGEDLEIRRAKLFQHVAENVEIGILDFDYIVGRIGPTILGNYTAIDSAAITSTGSGTMTAPSNFPCMTRPRKTWKNWKSFVSKPVRSAGKPLPTWAIRPGKTSSAPGRTTSRWRGSRIPLNSGNFGNSTNTIDFHKILNKGPEILIGEAQAHIDDFI